MNTRYVKSLLFEKARHAIGMANINATELRSIRGFFPDRNNQEQFSRQLAALTETRDKLKRVGQRTEGMFNSIMHRAFTGDLTAKWREAHMKEILSE
ncbi:MAG TPA: hypothetical protein PLP17_16080, partial [Oligoflexia bacterium]|nr:hypothetical protein [Oligoflexia bacterium]